MIDQAYVDLYWIPLGAGGWFVRRNGRLYEALVAARDGRPRCGLYHSALEVVVPVRRERKHVPTPVWGRDELRTGDMWNSNSVISWLITRSGLDPEEVPLPPGGRAPGWDAGMAAARLNLVGPGLRPAPSVHRAVRGPARTSWGLCPCRIAPDARRLDVRAPGAAGP
jgi:hypothetical protein